MGSSNSHEQEVEYNELKDRLQEWEEENKTQMTQIESFHKSIAMRSLGSSNAPERSSVEMQHKYIDPATFGGSRATSPDPRDKHQLSLRDSDIINSSDQAHHLGQPLKESHGRLDTSDAMTNRQVVPDFSLQRNYLEDMFKSGHEKRKAVATSQPQAQYELDSSRVAKGKGTPLSPGAVSIDSRKIG